MALVALRVVESRWRPVALAAPVVLLGLAPVAATILPRALESGIRRSSFPALLLLWLVPALVIAAASLWMARRRGWWIPAAVAASGMAFGVIFVKTAAAPLLDGITMRPMARLIEKHKSDVCVGTLHRSLRYGLNYYTVDPLPGCAENPRPLRVEQKAGQRPELLPTLSTSSERR